MQGSGQELIDLFLTEGFVNETAAPDIAAMKNDLPEDVGLV
jgi:hypothetical protein